MNQQKNILSPYKNSLYKLSVLSFVVVVWWVGFEIYFSYKKSPQSVQSTRNLQPIDPNLHLQLAESLNQRLSPPREELEAFRAIASSKAKSLSDQINNKKNQNFLTTPLPTPSPNIPPSATPSAQTKPI